MIKREIIILTIFLAALFLFFGTSSVSADDYNNYGLFIDGTKLDGTSVARMFNGFTYVPLNKIKANINVAIVEDKTTNSITISNSTKSIKIINAVTVQLSDNTIMDLDAPLIFRDNNIYFPILGLIDLLGYEVEVMDDIRSIRIKTMGDAVLVGKLVDAELNKKLNAANAESSGYPRVAYLTFDDGLDSKVTPIILDTLKKEDVKATFFIIGKTIEKNKSLLLRMIEEGHSIGNHTFTHIKENIYSSGENLKREIDKTNTALFDAAGLVTSLFRPPYGGTYIKSDELKAVLNPYRTILWNVDSMDSKSRSIGSAEILSSVINQVKNKKSAVIIMHDSGTHMETAKALPDIIKYLKDNGFTIRPIMEDTNIYYQY
ncbi:MAG: polysaccharide deacetylase family protein [Clostridia bacterium]|jgi:peptidoglycan/xylan/chitin deacetylase (PgdA/CDA1 family)|nr:polysaccharide deacetylase family protein [Clostridia bacterium]